MPGEQAFGHRLRRLRLMRGIKQAHLAELCRVDQATVSRWERGDLLPDPARRAELLRLLGADAPGPLDRALARLVRHTTLSVHLVCDETHRLLAASPAREAEWRCAAAELLGRSLWPFATDEIAAAEHTLPTLGWGEGTGAVRLWTGAGGGRGLAIRPVMMLWERLPLSDGGWARLCTDLPGEPVVAGVHRA